VIFESAGNTLKELLVAVYQGPNRCCMKEVGGQHKPSIRFYWAPNCFCQNYPASSLGGFHALPIVILRKNKSLHSGKGSTKYIF
jgi:hypothetical protein